MKLKIIGVLLILILSIGIVSASILPPSYVRPLTIGGLASGSSVPVVLGTPFSTTISIPFNSAKDTDCNDGYCEDIFGGWVILNSNKNILWNSAWTTLSTSPYTVNTGNIPFSAFGKYYIVGTVIKSSMTYNIGTGSWSRTDTTLISEAQEISVNAPGVVISPPSGFAAFMAAIWAFLRSIFTFLPA